MKFFNAIYLTIAFSYTASYCQQEKASDSSEVVITKLGIGVKAGFNFSTVSQGNLKAAPDARTSIYIGVHYEIPVIEDVISIQPELLYSQQGFEKRYTSSGERQKSMYKVNYISVPILARYYVIRGFSLEAGPKLSYKLNQKFDRAETDTELLTLNDANDLDFGFVAGISFEFDNGFFINGRFNSSFTEIFERSEAKNTVTQFGVGYKF